MAGLLSNEINNTDKISVFVGECKRMGISILPPDVNKSGLKFTPETVAGALTRRRDRAPGKSGSPTPATGNAIRYGLAAIKHVGESAMEAAIRERERGGDFHFAPGFLQPAGFPHRQSENAGKPDQSWRV